MKTNTQKSISAGLIGLAAFLGLQTLIYIANLNQIATFIKSAFWIWLYLWIKIAVLYDLHFKVPGSFSRARIKHENVLNAGKKFFKILFSTLYERFNHLFKIKFIKAYLNYLLLPGIIFWSTVAILYANLGQTRIQQAYAILSSIALIVTFWYLKEIFSRKTETVERDIFIGLSAVKIYGVTIAYAAGLEIFRYFCIGAQLFSLGVFSVTFLFMYQALFQHKQIHKKSLAAMSMASAFMGFTAFWVYRIWGYEYFMAGIFMAALYNFFWNTYHYRLEKNLTRYLFFELLTITLFVMYLAAINTNFKAAIANVC